MKALFVLFGAAGVVLAVLLLGGLSRTDSTAPLTATPATTSTTPIELAVVDPQQWARFRRQANSVCERAKDRVQLQIDRMRLATVPEQLLVSLDRTLRIQRKTIVELNRVKRPAGLGSKIDRFLAVFRAQLADDRKLIERLKRRTLGVHEMEAAIRREGRRVARVAALSDELGIVSCSRYVDYDFYE